MRPVRTTESNFTYLGPRPEIADLPCRREALTSEGQAVRSVFKLTDEERGQIAAGGQIELAVFNEPHPPVALRVVDQEEAPGDDFTCEGCDAIYTKERAAALDFDCGQCGAALGQPGWEQG